MSIKNVIKYKLETLKHECGKPGFDISALKTEDHIGDWTMHYKSTDYICTINYCPFCGIKLEGEDV